MRTDGSQARTIPAGRLLAATALLVLIPTSQAAWAQCAVTPAVRLTASDAGNQDYFGVSVAVSGDTAIVGAWQHDHSGLTWTGAAYVYVRAGGAWTQQAKLTPSDSAAGDYFGYSVAISGDTAVVGAWQDDFFNKPGKAYVFVRSGSSWSQQAKLLASDGAARDRFGYSVAVSGDLAIVGAPEDYHVGPDAGSAYAFKRTGATWAQQAKLIAPDAAPNDAFGRDVALDGDTAVIGARLNSHAGGAYAGAAYVFLNTSGTWMFQAKLTAADASAQDNFGSAVAVSADTVIVGANQDDRPGISNSGSAYVFVRSGGAWTQQAKLASSDSGSESLFGSAVALAGDVAIIGAPFYDRGPALAPGAAFVYTRTDTSWARQSRLTGFDENRIEQFGSAVAIAAGSAVIGMPRGGATQAGRAFVFEDLRSDCNGDGIADSCELAASTGADCNANNVPDACDLAVGTSSDCDQNATLDDCEIAMGTAADENLDGVPDACQPACSGEEAAVVTPATGSNEDLFGSAAAVIGNSAIIGAPWADEGAADTGAAYLFVRSGGGWVEAATVLAAEPATNDRFGSAIVRSGDEVLIGAPGDDHPGVEGSGAVYVLANSNGVWSATDRLAAPEPEVSKEFGYRLAADGDLLVVGDPFADAGSTPATGAAHVFARVDGAWVHQAKLTGDDAETFSFCGSEVAVDGDTVVMGCYWANSQLAYFAGAAFVFVRDGNTWVQQAKLLPSASFDNQQFGAGVAIVGDTILIGAPGDSGTEPGAVHVFERSAGAWTEIGSWTGPAENPVAQFGLSLLLTDEALFVGTSAGVVFAYPQAPTDWGRPTELAASGAMPWTASSIVPVAAADGTTVLYPWLPAKDPRHGVALVYDRMRDCDGSGVLDACESLATSAALSRLVACLAGPTAPAPDSCCGDVDADGDGDLDLVDFAALQAGWTAQ